MAKTLPEDVIDQILSRLPVKSLVRFTCVSKSWAALIYSSSFAKSHLKHSTIAKSVMYIMFQQKWYSVNFSQLSDENSGAADIVVEEIKYSFSHPLGMNYSDIVGSCNGLLYIVNKSSHDAVLFNPLTRSYCKIPNIMQIEGLHSPKRHDDYVPQFSVAGFTSATNWFWGCVYDQVNDDFNVVGIKVKRHLYDELCETSGWIYSPKLGSWRRTADMPSYNIAAPKWGVYVCNALHWVLYDGPSYARGHRPRNVAAFDMGTEKFRLLPLPNYTPSLLHYYRFDLEVLDGCLCFCRYSNDDNFFEIWMMREYGTENGCNWARLMKLLFDPVHYISRVSMKALALSENGKLLLVYVEERHGTDSSRRTLSCSRHTLLWYDVDAGSIKSEFNLPDNLGLGGPHVHIPSLVNPNPFD